jgi:hypothetical protein
MAACLRLFYYAFYGFHFPVALSESVSNYVLTTFSTQQDSYSESHRQNLFYLLFFAAAKTATANVAPLAPILTASVTGTAARAASKALISNSPQNTPNQELSGEPECQ